MPFVLGESLLVTHLHTPKYQGRMINYRVPLLLSLHGYWPISIPRLWAPGRSWFIFYLVSPALDSTSICRMNEKHSPRSGWIHILHSLVNAPLGTRLARPETGSSLPLPLMPSAELFALRGFSSPPLQIARHLPQLTTAPWHTILHITPCDALEDLSPTPASPGLKFPCRWRTPF